MTEPDPRLSPEAQASLDRLRRDVAAARASGEWETEPMEDPERFEGAIGGDNEGQIRTYGSVEDLRRALADDDGDAPSS